MQSRQCLKWGELASTISEIRDLGFPVESVVKAIPKGSDLMVNMIVLIVYEDLKQSPPEQVQWIVYQKCMEESTQIRRFT